MAQKTKPGSRGDAARLGILSFRSRIDNRENSPTARPPQVQSAAISLLRRQRLVEHLHRLGPKPLYHFLDEVERGASIPDHLERYAALPADFIKANGGDEFAPFLFAIDGGRT